jgi:predicted XRE-type DNA-binding protein
MSQGIEIISSSGNIFADLGLVDSSELLIKAELVRQISEAISVKKLTEIETANRLGIDLPKFTDLMRGKLSEFSLYHLLQFLNALGSDVEIRLIAKSESSPDPKIRVIAV